MISSLRIAGTLAGVLLALAVLSPAWGQQQPVLPSETYSSVRSAASVPTQQMPPVDTDAMRAAHSPWIADPEGRARSQSGLDRF